jgi:hypothetical protein
MPACPSCRRPVALSRPSCLYCGASLSEELLPLGNPVEPSPTERVLVVLGLEGVTAERLSGALDLQPYDAALRLRRKGFLLLAVREPDLAGAEAARLEGEGLTVFLLPEAEVRAASSPVVALRGRLIGTSLDLKGDTGRILLEREDLLLVVQGPITRVRQTSEEWKKVASGALDAGLRIHLHRRSDPRPVELDPGDFECGETPVAGSTLLEMTRWLDASAAGTPRDDGFRLEAPALGPEAEGALGVTQIALAPKTQRGRNKARPPVLDNLRQFRFYSAWRGALERRLRGG